MDDSTRPSVPWPLGDRFSGESAAAGEEIPGRGRTLTIAAGQRNLPRYFVVVLSILKRLEVGSVEIALPDGRVFAAEGARPGPSGRIDVAEPQAVYAQRRDVQRQR